SCGLATRSGPRACSTNAMPSRNRSAKACEPASLSPKDTAPLTDFSDIVHASRYTYVFALAPTPGEAGTIAQPPTPVQHPPNKALHIVAGRQRAAGPGRASKKTSARRKMGTSGKKRAAVAGGSKSKQGGVKQSGQEPLNVQKMDAPSNDRESLTRS